MYVYSSAWLTNSQYAQLYIMYHVMTINNAYILVFRVNMCILSTLTVYSANGHLIHICGNKSACEINM